MKTDIQAQIYEEIKDMTWPERIAYFRKAAEGDSPLAKKFRRLRPALPIASGAAAEHD